MLERYSRKNLMNDGVILIKQFVGSGDYENNEFR